MKTTADFLNDLRAQYGLNSDGKLSLKMGWARAQLARYRNRRETFGPTTAKTVAEALGIDPGYVLACMEAQRARTPELQRIWAGVAAKLAALLLAVGLGALPDPAAAQFNKTIFPAQDTSVQSAPVITIIRKLARALARALGLAPRAAWGAA